MAHLEYHATKLYGGLTVAHSLTLRPLYSRYRVLVINWIAELAGPNAATYAIQNNSCLCRQSHLGFADPNPVNAANEWSRYTTRLIIHQIIMTRVLN